MTTIPSLLLRLLPRLAAACAVVLWIGSVSYARLGAQASQKPPKTAAAQTFPAEQVKSGAALFAAQCGFCHGRDAMGGETGPDLTRSSVVAEDVRGDKITPVVRGGRPDKGMPPFTMPDADVAAIVAFIHDAKTKSESLEGNRRTVEVADLQTGNADAGKQYFNGAGGCATCHSPTGDFAGLATRLQGLQLMQRMLYPARRGGGRSGAPSSGPKVVVRLPDGKTINGRLIFRDEFTIGLLDDGGWRRSFSTAQVKYTVDDPLEAHAAQLAKYTDEDIHNVLAYLQTLK